jgi:HD-GYP domain-containing protein (c-di-GMP phosphodiesterase class II)
MRTSLEHIAPPRARRPSTRAPLASAVKDGLLEMLAAQGEQMLAHLAQIAEVACGTARILGLSPGEIRLTRLGAEFHDVGKVGIPDSILRKSGPLDAEEEWFMQRHSEIGACLVAAAPELRAIAPIVRAVHERPDGRGYPDGLAGAEIPIAARIIAVVDAFDAMTHERSYQRAMRADLALVELRRHAGTQFDHAVVEAFTAAISGRGAAAG